MRYLRPFMGAKIPMLDLGPEVEELWDELRTALEATLRSTRFILGPNVVAFEREAAEWLGVRRAVALNSGTDALVLGLRALGIGEGDRVAAWGRRLSSSTSTPRASTWIRRGSKRTWWGRKASARAS